MVGLLLLILQLITTVNLLYPSLIRSSESCFLNMFDNTSLLSLSAGSRHYISSFNNRIGVNLLSFIVLCLLCLSLVGCSSEDLNYNRHGVVTLKVSVVDGTASRSIDMAALNADRLYYQVYAFEGDKVASTPIFTGNIAAFTEGSNETELSLQLVAGEKYHDSRQ